MTGSLVVVLNQHQELCALHKPGGMPVQAAHLLESMRDASAAVPHFREAVERALALEALFKTPWWANFYAREVLTLHADFQRVQGL